MEKEKLNQKPEEILSSINRKMNVLISILMLSDNDRNWGKEIDKIQKLKEWGLENFEIAELMNKTTSQISDQFYNLKRKKK